MTWTGAGCKAKISFRAPFVYPFMFTKMWIPSWLIRSAACRKKTEIHLNPTVFIHLISNVLVFTRSHVVMAFQEFKDETFNHINECMLYFFKHKSLTDWWINQSINQNWSTYLPTLNQKIDRWTWLEYSSVNHKPSTSQPNDQRAKLSSLTQWWQRDAI